MSPVDLKDYVDVKERIRLFYAEHPDGRLCTGEVKVTSEPDGVPRVWAQAFAYRDPTDLHPGVGWSWLILPGSTNFTRGSEIENAETSAWGRAIGALGIGISASIASKDEIDAKSGEATRKPNKPVARDDGSLLGTAEVGDKASSDFSLRPTPEGPALGFRLKGERGKGILVRTVGPLARQLDRHRELAIGARLTVWGRVVTESFTPKGSERVVEYQVMSAERISLPGGVMLPIPGLDDDEPAGELTEAESEAIWDELERVGV